MQGGTTTPRTGRAASVAVRLVGHLSAGPAAIERTRPPGDRMCAGASAACSPAFGSVLVTAGESFCARRVTRMPSTRRST
jgi:hypothetical protein